MLRVRDPRSELVVTAATRKPNLFIALGLDPDLPWDQVAFERRLKEKQREWSKDSMRPDKKGMVAKSNLESLAAFERVAADPALREAEAEKARDSRNEARAARLEELDSHLRWLESKGYLLEEELQGLINDFAGVLSETEIRKRSKAPVRPKQRESSSAPAGILPLDPTQAKRIQQLLTHLGQTDLYGFLGLGPAAGCEQLRDRADQERVSMLRKAVKTAEVGMRQELAGLCLKLFESDVQKKRYDETLRLERIRRLTTAVDRTAAVTRQLVQAQVNELLRYAADELGIQPRDAQAAVLEHAQAKGYAVVLAQAGSEPAILRRCGSCGRLNEESKTNCTNCGQALQAPCPRCQKSVASDEQACGACGFPAGNRSFVRVVLGEIDAAMTAHDYELASFLVTQVRKAWPAPAADPLVQEIDKHSKQVAPLVAKIEEYESRLEQAVKGRQYYAARDLIGKLGRLHPEGTKIAPAQQAMADAAIKQAESLVMRSKGLASTQSDAAIAALQDALRHCADSREAAELLAKSPPSPPAGLRADVHGQIVQLTWQGSTSTGVTYRVLRKAKARPASADDGKCLASVRGNTFDDDKPEIGVPLWYAVYADRSGVISLSSAMLNQPVMVLADVSNLSIIVNTGTVQLAWQPPSNVYEVRVVRSDRGYPRTENDGQMVPLTSANVAVDRGLTNGRRYYYTLWSRFQDQDGMLRTSTGLHIQATPEEPPAMIDGLEISSLGTGKGRALIVEWIRPSKGEVAILHGGHAGGLKAGSILTQREFESCGTVLSSSGNSVQVPVGGPGVHFFTPAVIFQQMAYVGTQQRYVHAEDVSDLKVQNLGFALRLQWQWPVGCNEVVVAWSSAGWPEPDTRGVVCRSLTRAQYDLSGGFDIPNPGSTDLYIIVFAVARCDGERILAGGQAASARKRVALGSRMTINYSIKKARLGGGFSLHIDKQGDAPWPRLLLVRKQMALPLNSTDGQVILHTESDEVKDNRCVIRLPKDAARPQAYARLFLEDSGLYDCVVIRDPDRSSLKLF